MTDRISDERLAELVTLTNSYSPENHVLLHGETSLQVCAALRELQERRKGDSATRNLIIGAWQASCEDGYYFPDNWQEDAIKVMPDLMEYSP